MRVWINSCFDMQNALGEGASSEANPCITFLVYFLSVNCEIINNQHAFWYFSPKMILHWFIRSLIRWVLANFEVIRLIIMRFLLTRRKFSRVQHIKGIQNDFGKATEYRSTFQTYFKNFYWHVSWLIYEKGIFHLINRISQ